MLTTWHTKCLSHDINTTPWLSDTEQKYVDLIKCLDVTEVIYFILLLLCFLYIMMCKLYTLQMIFKAYYKL